jgi:phosphate:Na+ symporter
VLIGVVLFRSSADGRAKNLGRVGIGLGLMLLALGAPGHTLAPVETAPAVRTVLEALTGEPVLAVLIAGVLTWACHSSVAVVLLIASLAASGVIAPAASLALVLGANLGGTLPPLFEAGTGTARRLPLGNLLVRGADCIVVLPLLSMIAGLLAHIEPAPARLVVNFHTAFNLALAVLSLPFTDRLARLLTRFLPDPPRPADPGKPIHLETAALDSASVALANAAREPLRMADMFEGMLRGSIEVFRSGDRRRAADISRTERIMDRLGAAIRRYLADIGDEQPLDDEDEGARGQEILSAVINLEHAGDIVANNLLEFAARRSGGFASQELDAIAAMHAELVESLRLGLTVFLRGDAALSDARRLVAQKRLMRRYGGGGGRRKRPLAARRRKGTGRSPCRRCRQRHLSAHGAGLAPRALAHRRARLPGPRASDRGRGSQRRPGADRRRETRRRDRAGPGCRRSSLSDPALGSSLRLAAAEVGPPGSSP